MLIPLRLAKPSTYHSAAQGKPTSSNSGGCSKYDIVRISSAAWSVRPITSANLSRVVESFLQISCRERKR